MKKQKFQERGITLIALVITIIVLLILAGVTLSILLQTGIIENSQRAVNLYQSKAEDEVKQIDDLTIQMQKQFGILDNTEGKENKTITGSEKSTYNNPIIPVGFKTSNEGASWKSSDGETVDGWNSGLVIEDKDGNQFVWVPAYIEDTENTINNKEFEENNVPKYEKKLGPINYQITDLKQVQEVDLTSRITDEEKQIKDYGGFYIARYEAGIPESLPDAIEPDPIPDDEKLKELRSVSGIPVSKKNQVPWNNIDYKQAKENAEKMYTGDKVKSGLLTGKMWDTTLQWLIKTNAVTNYEVNTDGSSWGNYGTSLIPGITSYSKYIGRQTGIQWIEGITTKYRINEDKTEKSEYCWLLKTGNTEYTKRNNIYDLAGNLWEFTYERYKTSDNSLDAVDRGYSFQVENNISPGSIRSHVSIEHYGSDIGFRVALYIS